MSRNLVVPVILLSLLLPCGFAAGQETQPGAGASAALAGPDASAQGAETGAQFNKRVREMQEEVVTLKEKVYKTKVRLNLLRERILSNVVAEAWAVITHKNEMGSAFSLEHVLYYFDGKKMFFKQNVDGFLDKHRKIEVFRGNVIPGNHTLSVEYVYQGTGGLFSYLKGYRFKITSKYTFYASRGRIIKLEVTGYERGGITYSLEERPAIKFKAVQLPFNKENIANLTSGND